MPSCNRTSRKGALNQQRNAEDRKVRKARAAQVKEEQRKAREEKKATK